MRHILWVDDDYQIIRGLIRPLEQAEYSFYPVKTIAAAIESLKSDTTFDLAIVDIFLPLAETTSTLMPASITAAGDFVGEGLIVYLRDDLNLKIPIIVMSISGSDGELVARLEPYEVSAFLNKGELKPLQVKQVVERALDEFDQERATCLNLRSKSRQERRVGLLAAARMKPTLKLYRALVRLQSLETDNELLERVTSILKNYPSPLELEFSVNDSEEVFTWDRASLQRQLAQHHSNLNKLREQAAIYGAGETPLHLLNKIEAEEVEIQHLEEQLNVLEENQES